MKTSPLLFHPKVTFTAMLVGLASFSTMVAGLSMPLHNAPVIGAHADQIVAVAAIVAPMALWVATYGRSPASAVDNNTPP